MIFQELIQKNQSIIHCGSTSAFLKMAFSYPIEKAVIKSTQK